MRTRLPALLLALALAAPASAQTVAPPFRDPLGSLTVADDRPPDLLGPLESRYFKISGYFRVRGALLNNFDLSRGALPDGEPLWPRPPAGKADETVTSANLRLRLQPEVRVGQVFRVAAVIDALDNVVLGSTPRGYPSLSGTPVVAGSSSQEPPRKGVNSWGDSLRVKRAWAELYLPFGAFVLGRMANSWGLGMMASAGDGIDDDVDDSVDRVGFVTSVANHLLGLSFDINANGPTTATLSNPTGQPVDVTNRDDVRTLSLAVLHVTAPEVLRTKLRAKKVVVDYGVYGTWRSQRDEAPYYHLVNFGEATHAYEPGDYVRLGVDLFGGDAWFRLHAPRVRFEFEAACVGGWADPTVVTQNADFLPPGFLPGDKPPRLSFLQWGGVAQLEVQPRLDLGLTVLGEVGVASGDDAWGFGAMPNKVRGRPGDLDAPQFDWWDWKSDHSVDNFRFHPNYHVDRILWRRIVGTFTDGVYAKGRLRYHPIPEIRIDGWAVYSRTLNARSAPGLAKPLGVEAGLDLAWFTSFGFEAHASYAVLFPLAGLRRVDLDRGTFDGASPAHFAEVRLAFRY